MTLDEFIEQECNRDQSSWFHRDEIKRLIEKWEKLKDKTNEKTYN